MNKFFSAQHLLSVIVPAIKGTSMMTLYSYVLSQAKKKNFKAPVLLGKMACRLLPWIYRKTRGQLFIVHVLLGLCAGMGYAFSNKQVS